MKPRLRVDGYNVIGAWNVPREEHLTIEQARERLVHLIADYAGYSLSLIHIFIESGGAQMVLSIHMNEYAGRNQSGPQAFYREGCPAGRLLAGAIQGAMNEKLSPPKTRTALGGDYYILTLGVPSVLVECGFLSNAKEEALLLTEDYRQRVAQAIASGVLALSLIHI